MKGLAVGTLTRAGRQRDVDVEALAFAFSVLANFSCVRWVVLALMNRDVEYIIVLVEAFLTNRKKVVFARSDHVLPAQNSTKKKLTVAIDQR